MVGSYGKRMIILETKGFAKWLYHFTFSPAECESSHLFTSSPALGRVPLLNFDILISV